MKQFSNSQKGVSLYITLILTSIILAMALGMSLILVGQLKMTREIGNSTKAFYAADAGIEEALELSMSDMETLAYPDLSNLKIKIKKLNEFGADYGYQVEIVCCQGTPNCKMGVAIACPTNIEEDVNCDAQYFCYKSKGTYKDITRAIEIKR